LASEKLSYTPLTFEENGTADNILIGSAVDREKQSENYYVGETRKLDIMDSVLSDLSAFENPKLGTEFEVGSSELRKFPNGSKFELAEVICSTMLYTFTKVRETAEDVFIRLEKIVGMKC
jgi:hypothetical protein